MDDIIIINTVVPLLFYCRYLALKWMEDFLVINIVRLLLLYRFYLALKWMDDLLDDEQHVARNQPSARTGASIYSILRLNMFY